jgi:hypothetical protein
LAGALAGIYFTPIATPAKNVPAWAGLFALVGVIAANVVVLIIHEITKTTPLPNDESKIA